jgi:hypothetical protein
MLLVRVTHAFSTNQQDSTFLAISSLGSELTFAAVKPILQRCSADQLMLLEEASPVSIQNTSQLTMFLMEQLLFPALERRHSKCVALDPFQSRPVLNATSQ